MTTATFDDAIDQRVTTRYLDSTWSRDIRSLLYHTYRNEPVFQRVLEADRSGYDQRLRACTRELASHYFSENMPVIGVLEGERLIGVAFVALSEGIAQVIGRLLWRWKMILTIGYRCTEHYMAYLQQVQDALPDGRSYLLPLIGVHPQFRGAGHCRRLLNAIHDLSDLDQNAVGNSLCLSDKALLPFFESMGYRHIEKLEQQGIEQFVLFRPRTNC